MTFLPPFIALYSCHTGACRPCPASCAFRGGEKVTGKGGRKYSACTCVLVPDVVLPGGSQAPHVREKERGSEGLRDTLETLLVFQATTSTSNPLRPRSRVSDSISQISQVGKGLFQEQQRTQKSRGGSKGPKEACLESFLLMSWLCLPPVGLLSWELELLLQRIQPKS